MSIDPKSTHYDEGGIETLSIIAAKLTPEQYVGYLLGNIIKYSCRANWKGSADRDIEKVGVYQQLLSELSMQRSTGVMLEQQDVLLAGIDPSPEVSVTPSVGPRLEDVVAQATVHDVRPPDVPVEAPTSRMTCPDDGRCHHQCEPGYCYRCREAAPLSAVASVWRDVEPRCPAHAMCVVTGSACSQLTQCQQHGCKYDRMSLASASGR